MTWLAVLVGAVLGAPMRVVLDERVTGWAVDRFGASTARGSFPWGLLAVNSLGSAAAGVIVATADGLWRSLLLVGLCGAFTTFSGFGWQVERLWSLHRRAFWIAVLVFPIACVAAFWCMWRLALALVG